MQKDREQASTPPLDALPSPGTAGADCVLQRDSLEALIDLAGPNEPDFFRELVDLFLADSPRKIQALEEALERGEVVVVERVAHAMQSSSAHVGAWMVATAAYEIETRAREVDLAGLVPLVARMQKEMRRAIYCLNQIRAGHGLDHMHPSDF